MLRRIADSSSLQVDLMTIASMTGFARVAGAAGVYSWAWELKSVNAKGLDPRLRLPPAFDAIEPDARRRLTDKLARGAVYATLSAQRAAVSPEIRINQDLLSKLAAAVRAVELSDRLAPATLDGLLSVRGVVEVVDATEDEAELAEVRAGALRDFEAALEALLRMRRSEGAALTLVLQTRLDNIAALTDAADACPARKPEAIRARLAQSLAILSENTHFDQGRLYQEALMLAAKADVREELDRLAAHVKAARELLANGGAVGRRLDFLAQELGREANTLCAKSNDASLTALGLELRAEIEQFREQIQNIE
jgi:uncharacterized protein (TIGR00255 family)